MDERRNVQISSRALLRYQVISELEARVLGGSAVQEAIEAVLSLPRVSPWKGRVRLSKRTLRRWLAAYRQGGLSGLEAKVRPGTEDSVALPRPLVDFLGQEKERDPLASVPELIERARLRGIIGEDQRVSRTSVWRACRRMDLPLVRPQRLVDKDMRRFEYPHRMQMVLCDGKHFRAGATRARRVALHFLDDATRMGLEVQVGCSESTELMLQGLHRLIERYGLFDVLFVDHGSGFTSDDTRAVAARLGIRLIHGAVGYPEGRGKVERLHRTASEKLLRGLDGNPEVDPALGSLSLRLWHWMDKSYNHTPHESLSQVSPAERWRADTRELSLDFETGWFEGCFRHTIRRRVSADNVVRYGSRYYEVPRGHAGRYLDLTRHLLEPWALSCLHDGAMVRLQPAKLIENAYASRARKPEGPKPSTKAPKTAASLAYDQAFGPIVDADGGFTAPESGAEPS